MSTGPRGDLHADALAVLGAWVAPDAGQEDLRLRFVAHLREHADAMTRGCFPDHLTAGTLVVDDAGEHVLLNLHRKAGRWFAFGGHAEAGDASLVDVAHREATEESGLAGLTALVGPVQLDEHAVGFCDPRGTVHHLDVRYVAVVPSGTDPAPSEESIDVRWWPVGALPELEPQMHALVARAVALARERAARPV